MTQFPENQSSDINSDANCSPINKNQLEVLFQQLKFKILSQKLTKERIHFTFHNKEFIQLGEAIQVFMNAPYNFQKSDSIILCRYLIGEDQGFSNSLQFQDTQEVREIIDQLYSHPKIKSEYLTFQTILKQNYYSKLVNQKLVQCNIPSKIYNRDDFILLLKNNFNFTYEQIDYMLMMNYLYSNEVDNIDINVLRKFIQQECDLQATLHNLAYVCQESIRYIPKKINKVSYSDDDQSNFPIVESKDLKSVQTQRDDSKIEMRPPELSNQVQNIITSEQYLTFSQFKNSDQQLKSSESRKPSNHNNNSDILQYSQSLLPQATLKRPSEYQQITSDNSIHFNITNQFQSPQQNKKRINQISEFQTGKEIVDQRNIQYNVDNDTQITDVNKKRMSIMRKSRRNIQKNCDNYKVIKFILIFQLIKMNVYCQLAGYHQDEPLELICLNPECISNNKVLNCIACIEESHSGHSVIHYKKFITLLQKQGAHLLNEIDFKLQDSTNSQNDMLSKIREIIKQLTELQDIVNDAINKQKDMLERKLQYYEQFASLLPTQEIFNQAIKQHDQSLIQKLMTQFFLKVDYNSKRQEFVARNNYLIDQSEETEGENILFRKLREFINSFRQDIDNNYLLQNSQLSTSFKQKKLSQTNNEFKRSHQRIASYKRVVSAEKSPGSPDDRISITQSLSQFYYKPNAVQKRVGEQVQLIETQNAFTSTYSFHPECFGQGLQMTSKQIKLTTDNEKEWHSLNLQFMEVDWQENNESHQQSRYPMAVGICDQQKLQEDNFIFSGSAEHVSASHNKDHGCYLLNANGHIRSMTGQDMSKSSPNLRFYSNSTLELTFKPFHKQLIINRDQQVQTTIPLEFYKDQKLFFCVRLADLNDCIEIQ